MQICELLLTNIFVNSQCEVLAASGADVQIKDMYSETIHGVQISNVDVSNTILKDEIQYDKYDCDTVGENTDISMHKTLMIYVKYVRPKTSGIEHV